MDIIQTLDNSHMDKLELKSLLNCVRNNLVSEEKIESKPSEKIIQDPYLKNIIESNVLSAVISQLPEGTRHLNKSEKDKLTENIKNVIISMGGNPDQNPNIPFTGTPISQELSNSTIEDLSKLTDI